MLSPLWFLLTTACTGLLRDTGEPGDPCLAGQRKALEIGQGELSYDPITSHTDTLELIYGPQGGQHVVVAARSWYLDAGDFVAAYLRGTIGGELVGETWPYIDFRCNTPEAAMDGLGMLLVFQVDPEALHEQTLTIDLEVTDLAGDVVSASAKGVIRDPYQE